MNSKHGAAPIATSEPGKQITLQLRLIVHKPGVVTANSAEWREQSNSASPPIANAAAQCAVIEQKPTGPRFVMWTTATERV